MRRAWPMLTLPAVVLFAATAAWAAGFTLSTAHLATSALSTPVMFPDWIATTNKSGNGTVGKVQSGDSVTFVWSQTVDEPTLCSGWSNSSSTQSLTLQWSVVAGSGGADDTLQVTGSSSTCSSGLHVGTVDLGSAGYDTSATSIDFPTTTNALSFNGASTILTVTFNGQTHGTAATVSAGNAAVWTPDSSVKDRSGRNCPSCLAQSSTTVQF
jgi:hypothetical protein